MATQTGSIDLKSIKRSHDDASKYITKISDAGIRIHPYNDTDETADANNSAVITSEVISLINGGIERVAVDANGLAIKNDEGEAVAQYGEDAIVGREAGFHIKIDDEEGEVGFFRGQNKTAYMNESELYVNNQLSFGAFAFIQRQNGHFTLKLID